MALYVGLELDPVDVYPLPGDPTWSFVTGVLWEQSGRAWFVFLVLELSPLFLFPQPQGIPHGPHFSEVSSILTDSY